MKSETLQKRGKSAQAAAFVSWKIQRLTSAGNDSLSRANLARLRRGIGKVPGSLPELWGLIFDGMPEDLAGLGNQPSWGEWACYMSLTLFALHQQGNDWKTACMNLKGQSLGLAVRKLVQNEEDEDRVKRRFDRVVTSDSPEELAHHLRGLVQLLKAGNIPLDYPGLTQDLYRFLIPGQRDGVRLRWGRDFYVSTFSKALPSDTPSDSEKNA